MVQHKVISFHKLAFADKWGIAHPVSFSSPSSALFLIINRKYIGVATLTMKIILPSVLTVHYSNSKKREKSVAYAVLAAGQKMAVNYKT